jgi:hypothetical protein
MKKAIVIEKENGKRIVFVRQSDTMVLVLRISAALNIAACVFSTFNKHYIVSILDLIISFFTYLISTYVERNNEVYDFFDNKNENINQ